ncbi:hypothetical protein C8R43DRAFT_958757 [Mycena crocata]|nr:hypothetical protein C8R43DRAFT_958757 [Mycena crocata]
MQIGTFTLLTALYAPTLVVAQSFVCDCETNGVIFYCHRVVLLGGIVPGGVYWGVSNLLRKHRQWRWVHPRLNHIYSSSLAYKIVGGFQRRIEYGMRMGNVPHLPCPETIRADKL